MRHRTKGSPLLEMSMKKQSDPPETDCAAVWFARLERAKNLNDFERAAEAVRELRRLGVDVKFSPASDASQEVTRHE